MTHRSLFLIAALCATSFGQMDSRNFFVGQYVEYNQKNIISATLDNGSPLPSWLTVESDRIRGIPTEKDIGKYLIKVKSQERSHQIEIVVGEESVGPCGASDTYWIEIFFEKKNTLKNRLESYDDLKSVAKHKPTIRVYSMSYAESTRKTENLMHDRASGDYVVIWKVACDDVDEATEALDKFVEDDDKDYDNVKISKGRYVKKDVVIEKEEYISEEDDSDYDEDEDDEDDDLKKELNRLESTTELIRTTRRAVDNKPTLLNRLPAYQCTRGELCELRVPAETFMDVEDGNTFKLNLVIVGLADADIWMVPEKQKHRMLGVPMITGEFSYRLEARDKMGQMASAPFSVIVKPPIRANHKIQFDLDTPTAQVLATNSKRRTRLVQTMSEALNAPVRTFTLQEITTKNNKTVVTWSNNTLPSQFCDENGLEEMAAKMIIKQKSRTKLMFVKAMTNDFYVRNVSVARLGNCATIIEVSTTAPTVESVGDPSSQLILIGVLLVLLFLLALAAIIYCACLKTKGKKKATSTDYVGKGMPVVFPDEVEDISEQAHSGTPMLAREERPPLKVSQHENPLYKPPAPINSNSPRLGHASSSSNQRLPPPFIPP